MSHTAEVFWPGNTDIRFFWPNAALTTVVVPFIANIAGFTVSISKFPGSEGGIDRPSGPLWVSEISTEISTSTATDSTN